MLEYNGIKIRWHGHDTFSIAGQNKIIVTDPYKLSKNIDADLILISHNHFDHLSNEDIKKVVTSKSVIVAAMECMDMLKGISCKDVIGLSPGDEKIVDGIKIKAVPAYNTTKINPETKKPFHPKEDKKVGFLVTVQGTTIYHTGDSDLVPEMTNLRPDVLLIPVSGTYVMTAEEASKAVGEIKPKIVVPMHYGTIVGSKEDAEELKKKVKSCTVEIITKEE